MREEESTKLAEAHAANSSLRAQLQETLLASMKAKLSEAEDGKKTSLSSMGEPSTSKEKSSSGPPTLIVTVKNARQQFLEPVRTKEPKCILRAGKEPCYKTEAVVDSDADLSIYVPEYLIRSLMREPTQLATK